MGGRGAFLGGTSILKHKQYAVIDRYKNIKLITNLDDGNQSTPTLSASKNAIYATRKITDGSSNGEKQITVYGEDRKKLFDIDLDHDHSGNKVFPGGHVHYYNNGKRAKQYSQPNRQQRKLIENYRKMMNRRKG